MNGGRYKLLYRKKDKNGNIIQYEILDKFSLKKFTVSPAELKNHIRSSGDTVDGLKLTSDDRLILIDDTKESESMESKESKGSDEKKIYTLLSQYADAGKSKINYIAKKIKSPRAGRAMKYALMLGCSCAVLYGGVRYATTVGAAEKPDVETIMQAQSSFESLINSTGSLTMNVNAVTGLSIKMTDDNGNDIGNIKRDIVTYKLEHGFDIVDSNGLTVRTGDQRHLKLDPRSTWVMQDANGDDIIKVIKNITIALNKYQIEDMDGNVLGYMQQYVDFGTTYEVVDTNGNLLAEVERDAFRKDYTITFKGDSEELSRTDITTVAVHVLFDRAAEKSGGHSNRNTDSNK